MKTGQDAQQLGLYISECCNVELIFAKGDCFTRCPHCMSLCSWELEETVVEAVAA